jgi:hypothetical protein
MYRVGWEQAWAPANTSLHGLGEALGRYASLEQALALAKNLLDGLGEVEARTAANDSLDEMDEALPHCFGCGGLSMLAVMPHAPVISAAGMGTSNELALP